VSTGKRCSKQWAPPQESDVDIANRRGQKIATSATKGKQDERVWGALLMGPAANGRRGNATANMEAADEHRRKSGRQAISETRPASIAKEGRRLRGESGSGSGPGETAPVGNRGEGTQVIQETEEAQPRNAAGKARGLR